MFRNIRTLHSKLCDVLRCNDCLDWANDVSILCYPKDYFESYIKVKSTFGRKRSTWLISIMIWIWILAENGLHYDMHCIYTKWSLVLCLLFSNYVLQFIPELRPYSKTICMNNLFFKIMHFWDGTISTDVLLQDHPEKVLWILVL